MRCFSYSGIFTETIRQFPDELLHAFARYAAAFLSKAEVSANQTDGKSWPSDPFFV